jgi:hypothetical protein
MQIEIHTAEALVPGPSHLEVEIAIAKLKNYKESIIVQFTRRAIKLTVIIIVGYHC